jgi:DNA-binding transcriptional LysR family regulator
MRERLLFDKIDLHLIRVLYTVLTERSVSKAAIRLGMHQPAVSAALKRLREFAGDPLLVRSGVGLVPTDAALRMIGPAADFLSAAERLFADARGFDPASSQTTFRLAASDYLDPQFLPQLVSHIKSQAPLARLDILPLTAASDYRDQLALGQVDVVIGNWSSMPGDFHLAPLFDDKLVSLVSETHPAVRRGWDVDAWLNAEHIAPHAKYPGDRGVIEELLDAEGKRRNVVVRCPHFGLMPAMVAASLLVLTTGQQYCQRYVETMPLKILPCPVAFPTMTYYQLWHERTHASAAAKWLRDCVKAVAVALKKN